MDNLKLLILTILASILLINSQATNNVSAEQIQLASVLPKLQAIHEDAQTLLIKNSELKAQILLGLQKQNEAKLRQAKEAKLASSMAASSTTVSTATTTTTIKPPPPSSTMKPPTIDNSKPAIKANSTEIDYVELEEFNKWVDVNLDYAVKNTQASIEAFKEEAHQSNGLVDYSEQAIKDGIEGVKYWQSAVIFQDKTLKHEKIEQEV